MRQTEELARNYKGQKSPKATKKKGRLSPEILDLQTRLEDNLNTRVKLTYTPKGGTVTLHYYSDEELNALTDRLLSEE